MNLYRREEKQKRARNILGLQHVRECETHSFIHKQNEDELQTS